MLLSQYGIHKWCLKIQVKNQPRSSISFSLATRNNSRIGFEIAYPQEDLDHRSSPREMNSDFESKTGSFLGWFGALPGASFSDCIKIVDLRSKNAGRGIGTSSLSVSWDLASDIQINIQQWQRGTSPLTPPSLRYQDRASSTSRRQACQLGSRASLREMGSLWITKMAPQSWIAGAP